MKDTIHLSYGFEVRALAEEKRSVDVIASSSAIDGYGEIVAQDWDLSRYLANPVVLFGHNSYDLPIGHASDVRVEDGKLLATLNFVDEKASPMAERVYQGIKQGSLRAVSVGFRTHNKPAAVDVNGKSVLMLTGNELIEISVVPVPANPEAVALAAAKSFDMLRAMARGDDQEITTMKLVLSKLGLDTAANEDAACRAIDGIAARALAPLLELTKADSVDGAMGVVKAWQDASAKVIELNGVVEQMKKSAEESERAELIAKAQANGQIAPASVEWAKSCPIDTLKGFVATAPAIPQFAAKHEEETRTTGDLTWEGKSWEQLEPSEKHDLYFANHDLYVAMREAASV